LNKQYVKQLLIIGALIHRRLLTGLENLYFILQLNIKVDNGLVNASESNNVLGVVNFPTMSG